MDLPRDVRTGWQISSAYHEHADAGHMRQLLTVLRRPTTILITVVAATDVAYRLLVRETVRRGLGIRK